MSSSIPTTPASSTSGADQLLAAVGGAISATPATPTSGADQLLAAVVGGASVDNDAVEIRALDAMIVVGGITVQSVLEQIGRPLDFLVEGGKKSPLYMAISHVLLHGSPTAGVCDIIRLLHEEKVDIPFGISRLVYMKGGDDLQEALAGGDPIAHLVGLILHGNFAVLNRRLSAIYEGILLDAESVEDAKEKMSSLMTSRLRDDEDSPRLCTLLDIRQGSLWLSEKDRTAVCDVINKFLFYLPESVRDEMDAGLLAPPLCLSMDEATLLARDYLPPVRSPPPSPPS